MCVWNLQRIGISSVIYAQEHHDQMLQAQNGMAAMRLLEPYLQGKNVAFSCPQSAKRYLFNIALSKRTRASIPLRASTPVFKDAVPHEDGTVTVAFLDGHVKRLPAAEADALGGVFR